MSEENKELVRRWFEEVWNKGRADAIEEMFDENGIAHGLSDDPSQPIKVRASSDRFTQYSAKPSQT